MPGGISKDNSFLSIFLHLFPTFTEKCQIHTIESTSELFSSIIEENSSDVDRSSIPILIPLCDPFAATTRAKGWCQCPDITTTEAPLWVTTFLKTSHPILWRWRARSCGSAGDSPTSIVRVKETTPAAGEHPHHREEDDQPSWWPSKHLKGRFGDCLSVCLAVCNTLFGSEHYSLWCKSSNVDCYHKKSPKYWR